MKKIVLIASVLFFSFNIKAQINDIQVGTDPTLNRRYSAAFYDYSEPNAVNIKVSVWGFVRYPGRYLVPDYTTVKDLLSFAGGPTEDARLEDIRLYKTLKDSSSMLLKIDYNDLLWNDKLTNKYLNSPKVAVGDILLVPGSQRLYYKDYIQLTLSVVSTLLSITLLVINITK